MKTIAIALAALIATPMSFAATHVSGYTRSNGTYVAPHYRSDRDSSFNNNWSTAPNTNPYTGERGTRTSRSSSYSSNCYYNCSND